MNATPRTITTTGITTTGITTAELRDAYLRSSSNDSAAALDGLLAARPDDVDAHLLRIARPVIAKDLNSLPALARALRVALPHLEQSDVRAQRHAQAAAYWLAHRPLHAAQLYSNISASDPSDLLALRLAQSCWYFLGRRERVHSVAERALRAWRFGDPGYDMALAMTAFGCEEAGYVERADELAAESLEIERASPYAIHARAHSLASLGELDRVVELLRGRRADWRIGGRLDSHIVWHLAVVDLARGDEAAALATLVDDLLPLAASGPSAAADATDLAWRLELAGRDVQFAWERLAGDWAALPGPGYWSPHDLLAGLVFVRSRQSGRAGALRRRLAEDSRLHPGAPRAARQVTLPALAALEAFTRGAFAGAESGLRSTLDAMGGSVLQRELFEATLAALRSRLAATARAA